MLDLAQCQGLPAGIKFQAVPNSGYLENAVLGKKEPDQAATSYRVSFDYGLNGERIVGVYLIG